MTDIQFAYLIGRQTLRSNGGFGCQVYWEFSRRAYDLPRLTDALNRLVARHGMLRAVFGADATQRILPADAVRPVTIPLHDLSDQPPARSPPTAPPWPTASSPRISTRPNSRSFAPRSRAMRRATTCTSPSTC